MKKTEVNQSFTPGDVRDITGLTYRQLNDWEARGAIPSDPERGSKWRSFTAKDVFAILICAEIRNKYGTSVEQLNFINDFMRQAGPNHFQAAIELIERTGCSIWLQTDFESFVMGTELEFLDFFQQGLFTGASEEAYVMMNLTPLVNKILGALDEPIQLELTNAYRKNRKRYQYNSTVRSMGEYELLQLIRSNEYISIEAKTSGGDVDNLRMKKRVKTPTNYKELVEEKDFGKTTFERADANTYQAIQEITMPIDEKDLRMAFLKKILEGSDNSSNE